MASSHPNDDLILEFASGNLESSIGLLMACHIDTCEQCQKKMTAFEEVGGALLETIEVSMPSSNLFERIEAQLDALEESEASMGSIDPLAPLGSTHSDVPAPLREFLPAQMSDIKWEGSPELRRKPLDMVDTDFQIALFEMPVGGSITEHTHDGDEYVVVLQGGYEDQSGSYGVGDFIYSDSTVTHHPKSLPGLNCIFLSVLSGPLKFTI